MFKAAIALLAEFPPTVVIDGKTRSSDAIARDHAAHLLSALLVVPDNPDAGVLVLVRGLYNSLQRREWDMTQDHQALAMCDVISALCAAAQEKYWYHIDRGLCHFLHALKCVFVYLSDVIVVFLVDSNDALYGSDPKFLAEVDTMLNAVVENILSHLKMLESEQVRVQERSFSTSFSFKRCIPLSFRRTSGCLWCLWSFSTVSSRAPTCAPRNCSSCV